MTDDVRETGLQTLAFARRVMTGLLEGIDDVDFLHRPLPRANHALWIAGHVANGDHAFLVALGGREATLPESWASLFGPGSDPSDDAAEYPSAADVLYQLSAQRDALTAWFREMDSQRLRQPLPPNWARFGATHAVLMNTIAWHEGLHAGQLSVVRKSLGLAPRFG